MSLALDAFKEKEPGIFHAEQFSADGHPFPVFNNMGKRPLAEEAVLFVRDYLDKEMQIRHQAACQIFAQNEEPNSDLGYATDEQTAAGGSALATHHRHIGMAGGETGDEVSGQRESATAPSRSEEGPVASPRSAQRISGSDRIKRPYHLSIICTLTSFPLQTTQNQSL